MNDAKIISCDVEVTLKWECPNCGTINTTYFNPSSQRIPADEIPEDEQCCNCEEFFDPKYME